MENTKLFAEINESVFGGQLNIADFGSYDITCDGELFKNVTLFGNDECYSGGEFYQFGICGDKVYRFYFEIPEGIEDLGDIDYNNAYRYDECTGEF